jgi:MFS family permease
MSASVVSPVFVGRRDEMAALAGLMQRAHGGDAAFALIGGEAGVGKPGSSASLRPARPPPVQTVLLLVVSRRIGLGTHGYGYLFAGIGAGGLLGTALAGRVSACGRPRLVLSAALAAVGVPMALLAMITWPAAAVAIVAVTGTGAVLVEILTETSLQRILDDKVFGRAYGLAVPASLGGIVVGSLLAPLLVAAFGERGALIVAGAGVLCYALMLLRPGRGLTGRASAGQQIAEPAAVASYAMTS